MSPLLRQLKQAGCSGHGPYRELVGLREKVGLGAGKATSDQLDENEPEGRKDF